MVFNQSGILNLWGYLVVPEEESAVTTTMDTVEPHIINKIPCIFLLLFSYIEPPPVHLKITLEISQCYFSNFLG